MSVDFEEPGRMPPENGSLYGQIYLISMFKIGGMDGE